MLIIDQQAAPRLLASLSTFRTMEEDARYIYFVYKNTLEIECFQETIIRAAKDFVNSDTSQLFFLKNGDACLLSCDLHSSVANPLIDQVCAALDKPADIEWLVYQKVRHDHFGVADIVREQIEDERKKIEEEAIAKEQMKHELRRKTILGGGSKSQAMELKQRRLGRESRKIMIIEDDHFSRQLVSGALKKHYETIALADAEHALDMYTSLAPDMLLLDINLPDVTGHELLEKIMALDPEAYVVMLSGNADATNIKLAMGRGASGFIGKPFSKDKLFQYVHKCPTICSQTA